MIPTDSNTRHVAVVTTSRADFGHLHWPIRALEARASIRVSLIVIGAHLSPEFGQTHDAIRAAGFTIDETIECLLSSDTGVGMAKTIGLATLGLADTLERLQPDLIFVPADRYEMLAVANAALALRIPIAHLEGGDISEGAIDDAVRNALTKMSHLHFTTTEAARDRVLAMGEEAWRVHHVGAPSLDHLTRRDELDDAALADALGDTLPNEFALVSFHPVTLTRATDDEATELYRALENIAMPVVFCFPNSDAGSRRLVDRAHAFCAAHDSARLHVNLDHWVYWNVLRRAQVLIGNSSSGIMEAPAVCVPVIDIGDRQKGRLRAANIVHADATADAISAAFNTVTSPKFRAALATMTNPYGDGHASERIAVAIETAPNRATLLNKQALPLPEGAGGFLQVT
ncbi:MAG: UDP-N-acetylglucosamine 2-epimerase [Gammaproteobacteria bacterium]